MTGKLINLRRERKRRARDERSAKADVAAIQHGTQSQARETAKRLAERSERELDGKKRE